MITKLPETMRSVVVHSYDQGLKGVGVEDRPVPQPGPGQVLVKIAASPINPSDLAFIQGGYAFKRPLPTVPGLEASGTVIAAGGGLLSRWLLGKRVACGSGKGDDGTWAEYVLLRATQCLPLSNKISDEQGAMMLVNPFTAWALIDMAKRRGVKAVVQTAAGSVLGRMVWRLGQRRNIKVINVVRRVEQAEELRRLGMLYVVCSSDANFDEQLKILCRDLKASQAFDAVGGEITERLLRALPYGGRVTVYGLLSLQLPVANAHSLIFERKVVDGFYVPDWLARQNLLVLMNTWRQMQSRANDDLKSEVRSRYPLEQVQEALECYDQHMSGGKVLFSIKLNT